MPDANTPDDEVDQGWVADMLYGREPSAAPPTENLAAADGMDLADLRNAPGSDAALTPPNPRNGSEPESPVARHNVGTSPSDPGPAPTRLGGDDPGGGGLGGERDTDPDPVDLDEVDDTSEADCDAGDQGDPNAGAKKTAVVLGAGLVVTAAAIVAALVTFSQPSPAPGAQRAAAPSPVATAQPVPAATPLQPLPDQAIPYTASAPGCPPGSTSAQSLTDTASDSAWVCVRGGPGSAVDGQVLEIDLGATHQVVAVEVTPGWVAKTPGGQDEWLQHRVVTKLQYIFLNGNEVADVFTQQTGNVHGPVNSPLPAKVLASRVKVIILQTSRPPATPPPAGDPAPAGGAQPGFVESLLGEAGAPLGPQATHAPDPYADLGSRDPGSDPVDYTLAMSALKFIGYLPN